MDELCGVKELCAIKTYAKSIIEALKSETLDSFVHTESSMLQDVVAWRFLMMGECAEVILRKYPKLAIKYPDLPLKGMRGIRRFLRNCYDTLDYPILWTTAENELPVLIDTLDDILREIKRNSD